MGRGAADVPWVTIAIGAAIVAVAQFVTGWVPTEASIRPVAFSRAALENGRAYTIFTSLFAHGGLLHLAGNLITLAGLGPVFERELGRVRYVLVYAGAGIVGNLAHVTFHPDIPIVGASGSLFGLLGLLLVLDPRAEINLFVFPMPVVVFGGLYTAAVPFLVRFINVVPIAHEAHLGGMFFGSAIAFLFSPRRALLFVPGILIVFWGLQLFLVEALSFDYAMGLERPMRFLSFAPALVLWIAGSVYIGYIYRAHLDERTG